MSVCVGGLGGSWRPLYREARLQSSVASHSVASRSVVYWNTGSLIDWELMTLTALPERGHSTREPRDSTQTLNYCPRLLGDCREPPRAPFAAERRVERDALRFLAPSAGSVVLVLTRHARLGDVAFHVEVGDR